MRYLFMRTSKVLLLCSLINILCVAGSGGKFMHISRVVEEKFHMKSRQNLNEPVLPLLFDQTDTPEQVALL